MHGVRGQFAQRRLVERGVATADEGEAAESGDAWTVVAMRCPGPRAESAATLVAILMVEAGVMAVSAPFPYSRLPVAVSMTTAVRTVPRAEAFSNGVRVSRRSVVAPSGVSGASGADLLTPVLRPARTAGALGAGAGPDGGAAS